MKSLFYKIIYHPQVNSVYRTLIKSLAPNWKWKTKIPVSGTIKVKLNEKSIKIRTNPTSFATKHIFWDGVDQFEYVPIFKSLINKVNSFVDVGANTGLYSTMGAALNPNLKVWGFEPSNGPFNYFKKNIELNGLSNQIEGFKIALSNSNGEAKFYEVTNRKYPFLDYNLGGVGNLAHKLSHREMIESIVQVQTFDEFRAKNNISKVDLIKIDTEATEDMVLKGMMNCVQNDRPIIICETLFNRIEDKIDSLMSNQDYLFFEHHEELSKLKLTDTIRRNQDNGVRDVFFVPKEKIELVQEYVVAN